MGYILLTAGVHERTKWAWLTTYWSNSCSCFWFFMALSPFTLSLIPPIILMATITVLCSRYPIFFCNSSGTRAFNWTFSVLRAFSSVFILVMEFIYIAVGSAIGMTALWYSCGQSHHIYCNVWLYESFSGWPWASYLGSPSAAPAMLYQFCHMRHDKMFWLVLKCSLALAGHHTTISCKTSNCWPNSLLSVAAQTSHSFKSLTELFACSVTRSASWAALLVLISMIDKLVQLVMQHWSLDLPWLSNTSATFVVCLLCGNILPTTPL